MAVDRVATGEDRKVRGYSPNGLMSRGLSRLIAEAEKTWLRWKGQREGLSVIHLTVAVALKKK